MTRPTLSFMAAPPSRLPRPAPASSAVSAPARSAAAEGRRWLTRRDSLLLLAIAVLALAVRLPLLWEVPRFTDETDDMLLADALAHGRAFPLVNVSSYIGPLLTYIIAPLFKVFGPRLEVARLVVAVLGVAAILPTYLLGRRLGGPLAGLAAAALLAASAPHALVSSRIAWSHSLTPLFATLSIWLLLRAVEEGQGRSLVGAALAAGLAIHTHPTAVALLPAGALYLVWKGRGLLRARWVLLAAGAAALTNVNLLLYNLTSSGESVGFARTIWSDYATRDRLSYRESLFELLGTGARLVGGVLSDRFVEAASLLAPGSLLLVVLVVASLVFCALRGQPFPLLLVVSSALVYPTFLTRYEPVMQNGRYIIPLVPVCLAATGAGLAALAAQARGPAARTVIAALLLGFAIVWHVTAVEAFLRASVQQSLTNERYYRAESILLALPPTEEILVDADLVGRGTGGGGDLLKQFRYMLETNHRPYRVVERLGRPSGTAGQSRIVVLRWAALSELPRNLTLTPLLPAVEAPRGANFGIYRVEYPASG